ncbi:MAG TPA: hypothetical protein VOA41_15430 [Candidatus Dormibacteraeota bacterium]|nr:hypothetical protein [Candidatus Dormibacteraeota bacterium]
MPPRPPVPVAITDLAARQLGESVTLTFSLPRKTVEGETLVELPALEIHRGFLPAGAPPEKVAARLVYTIPPPFVNSYLTGGVVEFPDPIGPAELTAHAGEQIFYTVRTRVSERRASADSNVVTVQMYPVAEPIGDLRAVVTETAIELSWNVPARTSFGEKVPAIAGYRVYRAEVDPASRTSEDLAKIKLKAPRALLASTTTTSYRDTQIEFGRTYLYSVRSIFSPDSTTVESADSTPVVIAPLDTFPPAAPRNLVAVFVPAIAEIPAHVELSWGISPETDLAGYHVYRSERDGERGDRLTSELLPAPTFRDMSVAPGHRYRYQVTAVDRAGNESIPSSPISIELPQGAP